MTNEDIYRRYNGNLSIPFKESDKSYIMHLMKRAREEAIKEQLALFSVSDSNRWTCEKCGVVPNEEVTFEETHDGCGGYCS